MLIFLAHTQKPPVETRIYEKLAAGLVKIPNTKIGVLGSKFSEFKPLENKQKNISCFSVFHNSSGISGRFGNLLKFWNKLIECRPEVLVLCSPDLLPIAWVFKLIYKCKLIWDIQENYGLNLRYQKAHSPWKKIFFYPIIKILEQVARKSIDQFWMAEKVYVEQYRFEPKKVVILENKVPEFWAQTDTSSSNQDYPKPYFLFSGVITSESGVLLAISFFAKWKKQFPDWNLIIAGYIPDPELNKEIKRIANSIGNIIQIFGNDWITSIDILKFLANSEVVLMPYIQSPANEMKVPTKLWEAWFCRKPVLVTKNGFWKNEMNCIEADFENPGNNDFVEIRRLIGNFEPANENQYEIFESENLRSHFQTILPENTLQF